MSSSNFNSFEPGVLLKIDTMLTYKRADSRIFLYDRGGRVKSFSDGAVFMFLKKVDYERLLLLCSDSFVATIYQQYYIIEKMSES